MQLLYMISLSEPVVNDCTTSFLNITGARATRELITLCSQLNIS